MIQTRCDCVGCQMQLEFSNLLSNANIGGKDIDIKNVYRNQIINSNTQLLYSAKGIYELTE